MSNIIVSLQDEGSPVTQPIALTRKTGQQGVRMHFETDDHENRVSLMERVFDRLHALRPGVAVCDACGHVQFFRVDMATRKDWWAR